MAKTAKEILELTAGDIAGMEMEDYQTTLNDLIVELDKAEEDGRGVRAAALRAKLDLFEREGDDYVEGGIKDIKRQDWQRNHVRIKAYMRNHMLQHNGLPYVTEIAKNLKLSRKTVYEHLNEGLANEFHQEKMKQMQYLSTEILELLYLQCIKGNVMAGKVYLDYITKQQQAQHIKQQNNYLQVNNLILDEKRINLLPADDRTKVNQIAQQLKEIVNKYQAA